MNGYPGLTVLTLLLLAFLHTAIGRPANLTIDRYTLPPLSKSGTDPANIRSTSILVERDTPIFYPFLWAAPGTTQKLTARDIRDDRGRPDQFGRDAWWAWAEAIILAQRAYETVDATSPLFLRYFEAGDADFVKGVYARISGIAAGTTGKGDPVMGTAWVYEGRSPYSQPDTCAPPAGGGVTDAECVTRVTQPRVLPNNVLALPDEIAAAISLCPSFRDNDFLVRRTCRCLGKRDSYQMYSMGAVILHEFMHWRALVGRVPGYDDLIGNHRFDLITDWRPRIPGKFSSPINGYGPQYCAELATHANGDARRNADNYAWYAVSSYFGRQCPTDDGKFRLFDPSLDNE